MKTQQALGILNVMLPLLPQSGLRELLVLASLALEKATPKYSYLLTKDAVECPSCERRHVADDVKGEYYCSSCGQSMVRT